MVVNDTPVTLEDYAFPFKLPNKEPLTQHRHKVFVSTPQSVLRTVDEIFNSKEVASYRTDYACGHFQEYLFKFKRAVSG